MRIEFGRRGISNCWHLYKTRGGTTLCVSQVTEAAKLCSIASINMLCSFNNFSILQAAAGGDCEAAAVIRVAASPNSKLAAKCTGLSAGTGPKCKLATEYAK